MCVCVCVCEVCVYVSCVCVHGVCVMCECFHISFGQPFRMVKG